MQASQEPSPSVTAVIATRGRAELLRRAVRSIAAQDYDGTIEIVVVYDQSPVDPLDDLRRETPGEVTVRTVANEHSPGLAGARNSGIAHASGDVIAFCDDDDEWAPSKLRLQVEVWQRIPAAVVSCGVRIVTTRGVVLRTPPAVTTRADLLRSRIGALHPSSFLIRRTDLEALPRGVDESIPSSYGEDYDLLLQLSEHGDVVSVPEELVVVHWDRDSYFAGKWPAMAGGLSYLLAKHPDLLQDSANAARMSGQVAFAHAASGDRPAAWEWARRSLRHRVLEPRAWLALLVATRILTARRVVTALDRRGRGI